MGNTTRIRTVRGVMAIGVSLLIGTACFQVACERTEPAGGAQRPSSSHGDATAPFDKLSTPSQVPISLHPDKAPLARVIEQYNSQAALPLAVGQLDHPEPPRLSLTLDKVPTWEAIAKISRVTGLGLRMALQQAESLPQVELTSRLDPVQRFVAKGPVLLALRRSVPSKSEAPELRIECYYDTREIDEIGEPALKALHGVLEDGSRFDLNATLKQGSKGRKVWRFGLPSGREKQLVTLGGSLEANVRHNFRRASVPLQGDGPRKVGDSRLFLTVQKVGPVEGRGNPKLNFAFGMTLTWQTDLSGEDEARLGRLAKRSMRGKQVSKENIAWFKSAIAKMRSIELVDVNAYNKSGGSVTPFMVERHPAPVTEIGLSSQNRGEAEPE